MPDYKPLAGAAVGAASGAIRGKFTDAGIDNEFMKEVTNALQSGKAALFLLIRKMTTDEVMAALQGVSGRILRSLFDETKENALQEALAGIREEQSMAAGSTSV